MKCFRRTLTPLPCRWVPLGARWMQLAARQPITHPGRVSCSAGHGPYYPPIPQPFLQGAEDPSLDVFNVLRQCCTKMQTFD